MMPNNAPRHTFNAFALPSDLWKVVAFIKMGQWGKW
jgi:hypothetical protein